MIQITLNNTCLNIMGIYRPPDADVDEALNKLSTAIEETKIENSNTIIMGDINIDILNPDRKTVKLNETLASHNIHRINLPATRITTHSRTSIDCICTNIPEDHTTRSMVIEGRLSDHTAQLHTLYTVPPAPQPIKICRNLREENLNQLKFLLSNVSWENLIEAPSVEEAYNIFNKTLMQALNTACPNKKYRPKKKYKPKHFADEEAIRLKRDYLTSISRYEVTGNQNDKLEANLKKKSYDQRLKVLRQQASTNHIARAENKPKAVWEVINNARNKKKIPTEIKLHINDEIITSPEKIASQFNTYFVNVAEETLQNIPAAERKPTHPATYEPTENLDIITDTSTEEVRATITGMKTKNSAGIDEISTRILKHCADELTFPLTVIFNRSFKEGRFPSKLKVSKVYPKFKNGEKTQISNYRPISLVSTFSKVCEKIVLKRLLDHCARNNLLNDNQHGFSTGKSTTTAIIKLIETIVDNLEAGRLSTAILLDLSKAFDCLSHSLIMNKLRHLGVRNTAKNWFQSYLEERQQLVELKHTHRGITEEIRSTPLPVQRGVPQGSVLGPVLFILFVNDLPCYVGDFCLPLMYADDTTLILKGQTAEDLAISSYVALNMAYQYCNGNDLVANPNKTSQIAFGRRATEVQAIPDVQRETHVKFLGMTIDENITWTPHIDTLSKKLNTSLFMIKQIKSLSNSETAKTAYFSLFESHLRYGLAVWGGTSKVNLNRILMLQKKCIRVLAGLHQLDSCRDAFRELKIMTIVSLYIQEVVMYVDGKDLQRNKDAHRHNTRNGELYILPAHNLKLFETKPSYIGRKLHNSLPEEMHTKRGNSLRSALKAWLLDRPHYSLEEFFNETSTQN